MILDPLLVQGLLPCPIGAGKRKRDGEEGGDGKGLKSPRGERQSDESYEARSLSLSVSLSLSLFLSLSLSLFLARARALSHTHTPSVGMCAITSHAINVNMLQHAINTVM